MSQNIKPSNKRLEVSRSPQENLNVRAKKRTLEVKTQGKKAVMKTKAKQKRTILKRKVEGPSKKPIFMAKTKPSLKRSLPSKPESKRYKLTDADRTKLNAAIGFKFDKKTTNEQIRAAVGKKQLKDFIQGEKKEKGAIGRIFGEKFETKNGKKVKRPLKLGEKLKVGDEILADLTTSKAAYDRLGLKALLAHQPEIRRIRLTQLGEGQSGLAERGPDDNFYFINESTGKRTNNYAAIFRTIIKIEQRWTPAERAKKLPKNYQPDWANMDSQSRKEGGYYVFDKPIKLHGKDVTSKHPGVRVEYNPNSPGEKEYLEKVREIRSINDPERLKQMRRNLRFNPNEKLVRIYRESDHKLRYTAAICWELFKQNVKLKNGRTKLTSSFRSIKRQTELWNNGLRKRRKKFPHYTQKQLERENSRWVARSRGSSHSRGGTGDIACWYKDKKIPSCKFKGNKASYNYALRTGDLSRLSAGDRKAMRSRLTLEREFDISYFLGTNYYAETWHWNFDQDPQTGKKVYRTIG